MKLVDHMETVLYRLKHLTFVHLDNERDRSDLIETF